MALIDEDLSIVLGSNLNVVHTLLLSISITNRGRIASQGQDLPYLYIFLL